MKTKLFTISTLILALFIIGCPDQLLTGTFTIIYEIEDPMHSDDSTIESEYVDLYTISDYADHVDELRAIEEVSIVGTVINNSSSTVDSEVWLSYVGGIADPTDIFETPSTKRIFIAPAISGGTTLTVDWSDAPTYMENFDFVEEAIIDSGYFYIYGLGNGSAVDCDMDIDIVITFTTSY